MPGAWAFSFHTFPILSYPMTETKLCANMVKATAREIGFDACGLAPAEPVDEACAAEYRRWLAEGRQGEMDYLTRHSNKRFDPRQLVPGAQTVVCVALNYAPVPRPESREEYTLARYAWGKDYHDIMRERLHRLMACIGAENEGRAFCDTAPVLERYWAWRTGLGWRGRNTQIVSPDLGSYFFIGTLLLCRPADAYDAPQKARCGTCRRCVDACPAGALSADGRLDARRCLSYLTIEHRGPLPPEAGKQMGRCIYGCDRCAEACPWNKSVRPTTLPELQASESLLRMQMTDWHGMDIEQYRTLFRGSAVKRAKYEGLRRNIDAVMQAQHREADALPTDTPEDPAGNH